MCRRRRRRFAQASLAAAATQFKYSSAGVATPPPPAPLPTLPAFAALASQWLVAYLLASWLASKHSAQIQSQFEISNCLAISVMSHCCHRCAAPIPAMRLCVAVAASTDSDCCRCCSDVDSGATNTDCLQLIAQRCRHCRRHR